VRTVPFPAMEFGRCPSRPIHNGVARNPASWVAMRLRWDLLDWMRRPAWVRRDDGGNGIRAVVPPINYRNYLGMSPSADPHVVEMGR